MTISIHYVDPKTKAPLRKDHTAYYSETGSVYPIVNQIPRFVDSSQNYTQSFGLQWNKFSKTQIDDTDQKQSETRFFATTNWQPEELAGKSILEAGSGAGRFTRVILEKTSAYLWSFDYSEAVEANWQNNSDIAGGRLHLFQASIYDIPLPEASFDKVFCFGVLQHTPDFEESVKNLIKYAKIGAEIVVDFYPIKGFWTKIHAKYLLRPLTKKMSHQALLNLIEKNIDSLITLFDFLVKVKLGVLTRFLPIVDLRTIPSTVDQQKRREWAILDTFDMFSPEYDNPQRIKDVAAMFERHGAKVTFAGFVKSSAGTSAVVRGVRET
ncbi:class I SAM-dependent methyltransferase [Thermosynechococcus sp. HY213]|uniref:class I SAM-dependent methyltransferase n=1 Tax=Thermosynechococcus sp. HY213 TaxID=3074104 RepID=UPI0028604FED|nr:class I SAM-dependent methyltransferase [Thermosynechococcus sp. HY213]MDR7921851.1 class I SAM-dependent methyltransferase [Thermosynechococcus sp. HY213]